jgi:integrase
LNYAAVKGYRPKGPNPAAWRDNLEVSLPKPKKLRPVAHHPTMPYADVPEFMRRVRADSSTKARALELTVLCGSRRNEVLGARWGEFDLEAGLWTIPAKRMKRRADHVVPLSDAAVTMLIEMRGNAISHPASLVFVNDRGLQLYKEDMLRLARKLWAGPQQFDLHGFRSSFRDWVGDETDTAREIAEAALHHKVRGVEGAYRRGTALRKRHQLMNDWAAYCAGQPVQEQRAVS